MSSIGSGYDLSASQFSRGGKVFQIEYACKAVENSGTAIAIRGKDCVIFAVENIVTSKLYESGAIKRIYNVDKHIGMVAVGFQVDAKALVNVAREECANYLENFGCSIPLYVGFHAIRPFGVSLLLGSYEKDGPHLYVIEPSGLHFAYHGCAIGKAKQNATTEIEKLKPSELSAKDLVREAAKIIYTVHDEIKDKHFELDLSWVGECSGGIHTVVPQSLFQEAETFAKQALEDADDLDDEVE
ncbi:Proteasome endopeptidase complex [Fasciolopsis buskii]|uniref:Proteasome endopeptidase complex n=1 Tax=Fasciolopsis buskii TaxID=27845 RepID=A0A8E0VPG3_9TREM|nr:Proteasome endopeptidase complex [Fasciolopsis buski]